MKLKISNEIIIKEGVFKIKCEKCGFEIELLDEVCYYDINGYSHNTKYDILNKLKELKVKTKY